SSSMIRNILISFSFVFFTFSLSSCEKDITIKLDPASTDLVVDAHIENDKFPVVVLTRSLEYFKTLDPALLTSSYIHGAYVTMSNGSILAQLREDSVKNDSTGLMAYYYTLNDFISGPKFRGEFK